MTDTDYGLTLDRAWAAHHAIAVAALMVVIDSPHLFIAIALTVGLITFLAMLARRPQQPQSHTMAAAAGIIYYLAIGLDQALANNAAVTVLAVLLSFDTYAYHQAALRRVSFFRAKAAQ